MEYVTLPQSDLKVSRVCIGCWQFNAEQYDNTWPAQTVQTSQQIVDTALKRGVNFFDTAEAYGNHGSERVLGQCLAGRRRDVVIASKFGSFKDGKPVAYTPDDIEKAVTDSCRALQTDYIDLYQAHWSVNVGNYQETVEKLKQLQAKGRIRHYGVCNFSVASMQEMGTAGAQLSTNQLPYNLLWRAIEFNILPKCLESDMGVLAYSPLQQGLLSGCFQAPEDVPEGRRRTRHFSKDSTPMSRHGQPGAEKETFMAIKKLREICQKYNISMSSASLSWLLAQKGVSAFIVGARTPQQVEENCKLLSLSQDLSEKLSSATTELKTMLGPNPDMWAPQSRYQ